jgi:hypothetical protein
VALVLCALTFGGIMERTGSLRTLADAILKLAHSTGSLVLATVTSCIGTNIIAPDQYLSIIVPGRMYRETYEQRRLHPKLLSRTLEDAGTLKFPAGSVEHLRCIHVDRPDGVFHRVPSVRVPEPADTGDRGGYRL